MTPWTRWHFVVRPLETTAIHCRLKTSELRPERGREFPRQPRFTVRIRGPSPVVVVMSKRCYNIQSNENVPASTSIQGPLTAFRSWPLDSRKSPYIHTCPLSQKPSIFTNHWENAPWVNVLYGPYPVTKSPSQTTTGSEPHPLGHLGKDELGKRPAPSIPRGRILEMICLDQSISSESGVRVVWTGVGRESLRTIRGWRLCSVGSVTWRVLYQIQIWALRWHWTRLCNCEIDAILRILYTSHGYCLIGRAVQLSVV